MNDLKTIELHKPFNAPAAIVFQAIADGMLFKVTGADEETMENDFREGGSYQIFWKTFGTGTGQYLKIVPHSLISFTWNTTCTVKDGARHCVNDGTLRDTLVTLSLAETADGCHLTLVHEGLEAGIIFEDHLRGWTTSLEDLPTELLAHLGLGMEGPTAARLEK